MAIKEGAWNCSSCGTVNRGRDKSCRSCGNPKDDSEKFYLPGDAAAVKDDKLLAQAAVGPDWHCSFCGSANTGERQTCKQCGATIEDSKFNEVKDYEPEKGPGAVPPPAPPPPPPSSPKATPRPQPSRRKPILIGCAALAVLAITVLGYLIFATSDVAVTLTGFSWQREISVERNTLVEEEDWAVPAGGELVSSSSKVHHYDKVLDHYETKTRTKQVQTGSRTEEYTCGTIDKGNGFFEDKICTRSEPIYESVEEEYEDPVYREEPRYQTWYVYKIWRWKPDRTETASGADHDSMWPAVELGDKERESGRKENYEAEFRAPNGKTHKLTFPLDRWQKLEQEGSYTGKMNMLGTLLEIEEQP